MTPERFTEWREALGGRRFFLAAGAGIVTSYLVLVKAVDPITFRDIVIGTVGAYVLGATVQKVKAYATGTTP